MLIMKCDIKILDFSGADLKSHHMYITIDTMHRIGNTGFSCFHPHYTGSELFVLVHLYLFCC